MEVFKVERDNDFGLEVQLSLISPKYGDIIMVSPNRNMSDEATQSMVDKFIGLTKDNPKFEGVRVLILQDVSADFKVLSDELLEKLGLMRIPELPDVEEDTKLSKEEARQLEFAEEKFISEEDNE